jgi:nicotinate-nucleotide adenylyltransferase
LGGTFNPIHNGHVAIARQAREVLALDRVVLIPTGDPPHKPHENLAAAKDRFEMVRLAIASEPSWNSRPGETRRRC